MGQGQSDGNQQLKLVEGLQIARVLPFSPAHTAGLIPFFDIITAVDGQQLEADLEAVEKFKLYVGGRRDKPLILTVYNVHVKAYRDVRCIVSSAWGGGGLLGCSVEWCQAEKCAERSWHVVEVIPDSPVDKCGDIKAGRDYIIGVQRADELVTALVKDEEDFSTRVELWRAAQWSALRRLRQNSFVTTGTSQEDRGLQALGKLLLLVYDSVNNEVKEVLVNLGVDVDAPLGMSLATGLLHSLPHSGLAATTDKPMDEGVNLTAASGGGNSHNRLPALTAFVLATGEVQRVGKTVPLAFVPPVAGIPGIRSGEQPCSPFITAGQLSVAPALPQFPPRVQTQLQPRPTNNCLTAVPSPAVAAVEEPQGEPHAPVITSESTGGDCCVQPSATASLPVNPFASLATPELQAPHTAPAVAIPQDNPVTVTSPHITSPSSSEIHPSSPQQVTGFPEGELSAQQKSVARGAGVRAVCEMPPPLAFPIVKPTAPLS